MSKQPKVIDTETFEWIMEGLKAHARQMETNDMARGVLAFLETVETENEEPWTRDLVDRQETAFTHLRDVTPSGEDALDAYLHIRTSLDELVDEAENLAPRDPLKK